LVADEAFSRVVADDDEDFSNRFIMCWDSDLFERVSECHFAPITTLTQVVPLCLPATVALLQQTPPHARSTAIMIIC
jgi:hypothetical protein